MTNFVEKGEDLELTAPYNVASGAGMLVGHIFGVATTTQVSGSPVNIKTTGVFDLAKDTSSFSAGDLVYWDNTNKCCTSTSSGNKQIGVATQAQVSGDATVRVNLRYVA